MATRSSLEQSAIGSLNHPPPPTIEDAVLALLAGDHQGRERAQVRVLRTLLAELSKLNSLLMMRDHMADIALITGNIAAEDWQRPTHPINHGNKAERCKHEKCSRCPPFGKAHRGCWRRAPQRPTQPGERG
ncbi:hypothetical protein [Bradyrhizobium sp. SEMIA]|uniref:hypothetical protein n=1 Tax=Bradyrhizobium sp. SEMIA TaxID=2597515 RepID=UPI00223EA519|nr:hypothetical protein [Bradyrhizobium sp. SEMIA]